MTKHSYDKEFKEQAVQYYLDNKDHMSVNEMSKNLGVGASTLQNGLGCLLRLEKSVGVQVTLPVIRTKRLHGLSVDFVTPKEQSKC